MSDRLRKAIGITLIIVSLLLCAVPVVQSMTDNHTDSYKSGDSGTWILSPVETEVNGTIRVNYADAEELTKLPGIGETLSAMIVSEREQNGPYYYAEDLEAVKGIGPGTLRKFRDMLDLTLDESEEENGLSGAIP